MLVKTLGIEGTLNWFKEAVPEPTEKNKSVQMGVHIEEFLEGIEALTPITDMGELVQASACNTVKRLADNLKANSGDLVVLDTEDEREQMLDALADQIVTAVGTAYMHGLDIVGALNEVNRSNFSKFEDGKAVFQESGKLGKGRDYTPPDLKPFI